MIHIVYIVIIVILAYYNGKKRIELEKQLEDQKNALKEVVEYTELLEKKCDRLESEKKISKEEKQLEEIKEIWDRLNKESVK